jgi:proteasome accessory factor B
VTILSHFSEWGSTVTQTPGAVMSSIGKIRRILQLVEFLQTGRAHTAAELAAHCRVSRRTTFRDLKLLQDSGVRIHYDAHQQGYWIPVHAYLPPANLSLSETLSLLILARELGSHERGIPFQDVARDAALKLQGNLPAHLSQHLGDYSSAVHIDAEPTAEPTNGRTHYEHVLKSLHSKTKLRVHYESIAEQSTIRTLLSPYRLLFRRHAWYVIGRSSVHRAVRTFHVGRIVNSELTEELYKIPPRFSLKRYFGNAWNLVRERNARTRARVRFLPLVARNVAEVCWHPTQKLLWNDDGSLDFSVIVDGISEISWWILSYGDQAQVLEPPDLKALIAQRARNMVRQYEPAPKDPSHVS